MAGGGEPKRYELGSVEWVGALRDYLTAKLGDGPFEGSASMSFETTDPPTHLLRGGQETVGWFLRLRDGRLEVGDRALPDADVRLVIDYETQARSFRIQDPAEYAANLQRLNASGAVKSTGDRTKVRPIQELFVRADVPNGFYHAYTA